MNFEQIKEEVKNNMSEKRFRHSCGVAKRAVELAKIYGYDEEIAQKVGIAHDIAKEMPQDLALKYIQENNIIFDEIEKEEPALWHSKIGADIAEKKFGFTKEMKQAIIYHTTGNVNMNVLDKIIYLADKTEEGRTKINLEEANKISNENLDEGMLYVAKYSVEYSLKKNSLIHPDTIYLINKIINQKKNK